MYSLSNPSDDGLYHPEELPSYSDLFHQQDGVVIEVDFDAGFGNKLDATSELPAESRQSPDSELNTTLEMPERRMDAAFPTGEPSDRHRDAETAEATDLLAGDDEVVDVSKLPKEHRGSSGVGQEGPSKSPVVVKELPPLPNNFPFRSSNQPVLNYRPPASNSVRGVLFPQPGIVKSLPQLKPAVIHHNYPAYANLAGLPPYRSKLEDYTYSPQPARKRHIAGYPLYTPRVPPSNFVIAPPPLASFVIARLRNQSVPAYPIPLDLLSKEAEDQAVVTQRDKHQQGIPRPPGTPAPSQTATV